MTQYFKCGMSLLLGRGGGGDKNTLARLCAKNAGGGGGRRGLMCEGGRICGTLW